MADSLFSAAPLDVRGSNVKYTDEAIESTYDYTTTRVVMTEAAGGAAAAAASGPTVRVEPVTTRMTIRTERKVPKVSSKGAAVRGAEAREVAVKVEARVPLCGAG